MKQNNQLTRQGLRNLDVLLPKVKSRGRVLDLPPDLQPKRELCLHKETHRLASGVSVCADCQAELINNGD